MANCVLNKDLLRSTTCAYNLLEVKDIYLANFADITSAHTDYNCESGVTLDSLVMESGASFYHIEPQKNSTTYTDELVVEDNGNKYRTQTITFTVAGKYDKDMVCSVDALALGRFFVVVKTANGDYLALGSQTGLEASAQSIAGGGDNNGVTVTLSANVAESAVPLGEAAINKVLGKE